MQQNCCLLTRHNCQKKCCASFIKLCCKKSKKERLLIDCYDVIAKEIELTRMLKISRVIKGLVKEKMSKYEWHLACIKYGLKGTVLHDSSNNLPEHDHDHDLDEDVRE